MNIELEVSDPSVEHRRGHTAKFTTPRSMIANPAESRSVSEAAAALADGEARGVVAPVRREPSLSHRVHPQTTASAHRMHALLVDDGPHGRRRPAIRPAAHAHER